VSAELQRGLEKTLASRALVIPTFTCEQFATRGPAWPTEDSDDVEHVRFLSILDMDADFGRVMGGEDALFEGEEPRKYEKTSEIKARLRELYESGCTSMHDVAARCPAVRLVAAATLHLVRALDAVDTIEWFAWSTGGKGFRIVWLDDPLFGGPTGEARLPKRPSLVCRVRWHDRFAEHAVVSLLPEYFRALGADVETHLAPFLDKNIHDRDKGVKTDLLKHPDTGFFGCYFGGVDDAEEFWGRGFVAPSLSTDMQESITDVWRHVFDGVRDLDLGTLPMLECGGRIAKPKGIGGAAAKFTEAQSAKMKTDTKIPWKLQKALTDAGAEQFWGKQPPAGKQMGLVWQGFPMTYFSVPLDRIGAVKGALVHAIMARKRIEWDSEVKHEDDPSQSVRRAKFLLHCKMGPLRRFCLDIDKMTDFEGDFRAEVVRIQACVASMLADPGRVGMVLVDRAPGGSYHVTFPSLVVTMEQHYGIATELAQNSAGRPEAEAVAAQVRASIDTQFMRQAKSMRMVLSDKYDRESQRYADRELVPEIALSASGRDSALFVQRPNWPAWIRLSMLWADPITEADEPLAQWAADAVETHAAAIRHGGGRGGVCEMTGVSAEQAALLREELGKFSRGNNLLQPVTATRIVRMLPGEKGSEGVAEDPAKREGDWGPDSGSYVVYTHSKYCLAKASSEPENPFHSHNHVFYVFTARGWWQKCHKLEHREHREIFSYPLDETGGCDRVLELLFGADFVRLRAEAAGRRAAAKRGWEAPSCEVPEEVREEQHAKAARVTFSAPSPEEMRASAARALEAIRARRSSSSRSTTNVKS
jgi:hypothetical protein